MVISVDFQKKINKFLMEKFSKNLKKKLNICELPVRNFCNQAHKDILNIWKCKIFFEFSNKWFQWLRIFVQIKNEHYFLKNS